MTPENIFLIYLAAIFGLCWGSFLNVIAHRLLCGTSPFRGRSHCPSCAEPIAWHDLIPVLSWICLRARCRTCAAKISWLYPFIETLTALSFIGLILCVPSHYWPALFLYISALIITIRTDIAELVIMRQTTLFIMPIGVVMAYYGLIPISIQQSLLGGLIGAGVIGLTSLIFWFLTKKIGIGQGDIELCGLIGGFTGLTGWWFALMVGSITGTLIGLTALLIKPKNSSHQLTKLPFGALLAFGSLVFTIFQTPIEGLLAKFLLVV